MAKVLVNKSAHAVVIDGVLFSPGSPISGLDVEALKKKFPMVGDMIEAGEMVELDEAQAAKEKAEKEKAEAEKAKEEKAFEEQTLDELKAYAAAHNIDISKLKKRGDIIAVLKEATNRA